MLKQSKFISERIFVAMLLICTSLPMIGQSMDRQVISNAGENFQTANGSLQFTIGEIAVETLVKDVQLTQGFHQEWAVITLITAGSAELLDVKVYPNPTLGILNIETEAAVRIFLYDLSGKLKLTSTQPSGYGQIDIGDFPSGIFILELKDDNGKKRLLKIEKVE